VGATRAAGWGAVVAGLVVLALPALQILGTGAATADAQQELSAELDRSWSGAVAGGPTTVAAGSPIARMTVPRFGDGWTAVVSEGTAPEVLDSGPGYYTGSALPGQPGNAGIAGHRVTHGGPFRSAGELRSCDPILVETAEATYVYRVLPLAGEAADWARGAGSREECAGVGPLDGPYAGTVGLRVVAPEQVDVLAPVPGRIGVPARPGTALLTLTTCHPEYSDRERLVVHAVLTATTSARS
jgi:sortase A